MLALSRERDYRLQKKKKKRRRSSGSVHYGVCEV
jgi:hypothetical protein